MEDKKKDALRHELTLVYEDSLTITGVRSVPAFDNSAVEVVLDTEKLKITGKDLEIDCLDLDKGTLKLVGTVTSLVYHKGEIKKSLLQRLFK